MGMFGKKEEYNYFDSFASCAKSASEAANYLDHVLKCFDAQTLDTHVEKMHKIENTADGKKHELTHKLAHEFMTPIEREDISALSQELDNIVDAIEDVVRRIYMFNVVQLRKEALEFSELIVKCCEAFEKVVAEFPNFKKSKTISSYIIEVNRLENDGDKLHAASMRRLFVENIDTKNQLVWMTIFESLEGCLDACEHAANIIEGVIMKNT